MKNTEKLIKKKVKINLLENTVLLISLPLSGTIRNVYIPFFFIENSFHTKNCEKRLKV